MNIICTKSIDSMTAKMSMIYFLLWFWCIFVYFVISLLCLCFVNFVVHDQIKSENFCYPFPYFWCFNNKQIKRSFHFQYQLIKDYELITMTPYIDCFICYHFIHILFSFFYHSLFQIIIRYYAFCDHWFFIDSSFIHFFFL